MVLRLTAASACVCILRFGEAKHEIDTVEQHMCNPKPAMDHERNGHSPQRKVYILLETYRHTSQPLFPGVRPRCNL